MGGGAPTPSPSAAALHAALLGYSKAPGMHQLALRQPAILFASLREILQIAAGRGGAERHRDPAALRHAAAFFLRAALLYPGADHYAVLGLSPASKPAEFKERYRLLMRLIHPDFAATDAPPWPADAAVRVNRAYEVLSSPVLRAAYDQQFTTLASPRPAEPADIHRPKAAARVPEREGLRINRKVAWALATAVGILGIVILSPRSDPGGLVQKQEPQAAQAVAGLPAPPESGGPAARPATLVAKADAAAAPADAVPVPSPAPPAAIVDRRVVSAPAPAPMAVAAHTATPAPTAPTAPASAAPAPPAAAPVPAAAPRAPTLRPPAPDIAPSRPAAVTAPVQAFAQPRPPTAPAPASPVLDAAAAPAPQAPAAAVPVAVQPSVSPVLAPAPAPAPATVAAPAPPPARALPVATAASGPTLADAQPVLTQMLQLLESGSGDQLLRLLEGEARHAAPARALSRQYEQIVQAGRPVRLTHVEFRGEQRDGALFVTGRIRLHAGEPTVGSNGERLLIRAEFVSRGGAVILKGLSGAAD